jgi:two-component system, NtrC family, nitrogen regulation sensor histidine kinase GlnL
MMSFAPVQKALAKFHGHASVLDALPNPLLAIDDADRIVYANASAEEFFKTSAAVLGRLKIDDVIPATSPLHELLSKTRDGLQSFNEYGVHAGTPRTGGERLVDVQSAHVHDLPGVVLLTIHPRSVAQKLDQQLSQRTGVRAVTGLAATLAHEIKNPLSGIRGAAQLLAPGLAGTDRELAELIQTETDRIRDLVDEMEVFSDDRPLSRRPVNIHEVLEHVKQVARLGFASNIRIIENYDPSLPAVAGDRSQLIQLFLNLVKNAAEAIQGGKDGGEIMLATAYRPGVRLALPGAKERVALPLEVTVQDSGPGIPQGLKPYLFDPFVSTKLKGKGLGLAIVAKIVRDHGGIIECDANSRNTTFRILLPMDHRRNEERPA